MKMEHLTIGERVKDLRNAKGLTLKELSEAIQAKTGHYIAVSTLSDLEAYGNSDKVNKEPRLSTIKAITEYFGISLDYLAGISEVKSPNIERQAINKMLGLSENAIEFLEKRRPLFECSAINAIIEYNNGDIVSLIYSHLFHKSNDAEIEVGNNITIDGNNIADIFLLEIVSELRSLRKELSGGAENGKHTREKE